MTTAGKNEHGRTAKFFGEALLSQSFDMGGLVSGTLLAVYLGVFTSVPWAILLFPGILSIRGAIGGLFSGRVSTALHLGSIKPAFFRNTPEYYQLIQSVLVLTLLSAVIMGGIAAIFSTVVLGTLISDVFVILIVILTTMGLSFLVVSPVTIGVSILSTKRGLDPDVITYPVVSTVADILVTLCYTVVLVAYTTITVAPLVFVLFDCILIIASIRTLLKERHSTVVTATIREFLATLVIVVLIVNMTGVFLDRISRIVQKKPELYMVYPALIDTVGDVGSIIGSTATTELTLGTLKPSITSIRKQMGKIAMGWLASIVMFSLYGLAALMLFNLKLIAFVALLLVLFSVNGMAVFAIIIIAFTLAIVTAEKGLNPDNFVIPIESSLADTITTLSILALLVII